MICFFRDVSICGSYSFLQGRFQWKRNRPHLPHALGRRVWTCSKSQGTPSPDLSIVSKLVILADFAWREMSTVHELVQRFGSRWSETEVEAAVWKLVGDAAASGRLLVDLTEVELSRGTPLALLEPGSPPILPDPLPSSLEEVTFDSPSPESSSEGDLVLDPRIGIPGPTF